MVVVGWPVEEVVDCFVKKEVICRWAGSMAAPANWRFVRGADIFRLSSCNTECLSMTKVVIIVKLESCGRIAALKVYTNKQC